MTYDKRILCNQSSREGIIMAVNHYRQDIAFINELVAQAKKDFPGLEDGKIQVFVVTHSVYNQGFWGDSFSFAPRNL